MVRGDIEALQPLQRAPELLPVRRLVVPLSRALTSGKVKHPAALEAGVNGGRLPVLVRDGGVDMAQLSYERLQAQALNNLDNAYGERVGSDDQAAALARAQVHALLTVGAALKDLAQAIREGR